MKKLNIERQVGVFEEVDDPEVSQAFEKMQRLPPFKVIRRMIVSRIFDRRKLNISEDGGKLLDLGCGTGHLLADIHKKNRKMKKNLKLNGIDLSQEMIKQCNENLEKHNISDVNCKLADGKSIPFENDSFMIITSSLSLHHWPNPAEVFSEIYRVLQPGGYLFLFDFFRDSAKFYYSFLKFITKHVAYKDLRKVNEPLGSLLASYTIDELQSIINSTIWKNQKVTIDKKGPFMFLQMEK